MLDQNWISSARSLQSATSDHIHLLEKKRQSKQRIQRLVSEDLADFTTLVSHIYKLALQSPSKMKILKSETSSLEPKKGSTFCRWKHWSCKANCLNTRQLWILSSLSMEVSSLQLTVYKSLRNLSPNCANQVKRRKKRKLFLKMIMQNHFGKWMESASQILQFVMLEKDFC